MPHCDVGRPELPLHPSPGPVDLGVRGRERVYGAPFRAEFLGGDLHRGGGETVRFGSGPGLRLGRDTGGGGLFPQGGDVLQEALLDRGGDTLGHYELGHVLGEGLAHVGGKEVV